MSVILSISHVSRSFPGVQALDDVSIDVERGSIHALVGANGAGKSTLMKILSGALAANAGEMTFEGQKYQPSSPNAALKAGVATIYQEFNLLNKLPVIANINLGKEPHHFGILDERSEKEKAARVLAQLNAGHIALQTQVSALKVGEKQIIEIAKALISDCKMLIMDEPTAALNDMETATLFGIIQDLKSKGATVLYVSHRLKEIFALADTVTVLRDGKNVHTSSISEVTPDSLIGFMLGRRIEGAFPERNLTLGSEVLRVERLSSEGAFEGINFSLHGGEVVGITGLAGSGKVELGKALIGDWPIDSGRVYLHGSIYKPDPSRAKSARIGYMPEDRKKEGVLEELPVQRNISLPSLAKMARMFGVIPSVQERLIAQREVDELEIRTPSLWQLVRNLSGGNQQKVSLAKWLAAGSRILLLVEPTQGIDVGVKFEVYKLIQKLSSDGNAIILVSSEIPELLGLAHHILVLHNGKSQAFLEGNKTSEEEILRHTFGQKGEKTYEIG